MDTQYQKIINQLNGLLGYEQGNSPLSVKPNICTHLIQQCAEIYHDSQIDNEPFYVAPGDNPPENTIMVSKTPTDPLYNPTTDAMEDCWLINYAQILFDDKENQLIYNEYTYNSKEDITYDSKTYNIDMHKDLEYLYDAICNLSESGIANIKKENFKSELPVYKGQSIVINHEDLSQLCSLSNACHTKYNCQKDLLYANINKSLGQDEKAKEVLISTISNYFNNPFNKQEFTELINQTIKDKELKQLSKQIIAFNDKLTDIIKTAQYNTYNTNKITKEKTHKLMDKYLGDIFNSYEIKDMIQSRICNPDYQEKLYNIIDRYIINRKSLEQELREKQNNINQKQSNDIRKNIDEGVR